MDPGISRVWAIPGAGEGIEGGELMVLAGGGIGTTKTGEDARLCMGGKVRRGNGGGTCGQSLRPAQQQQLFDRRRH